MRVRCARAYGASLLDAPSRTGAWRCGVRLAYCHSRREGSAPQVLWLRTALKPRTSFRLVPPARIFLPLQAQVSPVRIFRKNQFQLLFPPPAFDLDFPGSRAGEARMLSFGIPAISLISTRDKKRDGLNNSAPPERAMLCTFRVLTVRVSRRNIRSCYTLKTNPGWQVMAGPSTEGVRATQRSAQKPITIKDSTFPVRACLPQHRVFWRALGE
jgi:hypothetical protein